MEYADEYSGWGNAVIYDMCTKRPLHEDRDTVCGKLWLIGRSYSASIERKAGKDFKIEHAADILIASSLDQEIKNLIAVGRPTSNNVSHLLAVHKLLTDLLHRATGLNKRSLASKYLHFHAPEAVFIFDSRADKKIRECLNGVRSNYYKGFDDSYSHFCARCLHYRDKILEPQLGKLVTPRKLDMELLGYKPY